MRTASSIGLPCLLAVLGAGLVLSEAVMLGQVRDGGASPRPATGVAPAASGSVAGVVTAAESRQPVSGAEVRLRGASSAESRVTRSDAAGRYAFAGVADGAYSVSASKAGYLTGFYGQRVASESAARVTVSDGRPLAGIDIALRRSAVIVVRMVDDFGDPVAGLLVQAFIRRQIAGQERLVNAGGDGLLSSTDDRGEIRLFGLPPGQYYVGARIGTAASLAVSRPRGTDTFYPGVTALSEAHSVTVAEGEVVNLTFSLVVSERFTVSGLALDASGRPLMGGSLQLRQNRAGGVSSRTVGLSASGEFSIGDVSPGEYVLQARSQAGDAGTEYAALAFRVDHADVHGVIVRTKPGATIRGRLVFDNPAMATGLGPAAFTVEPVFTTASGLSLSPGRSTTLGDWTFVVSDVMGAGYLSVKAPAGWFVKRILADSRDVSDVPLDFDDYAGKAVEVVLTRSHTSIAGHAVAAGGQPIVSYVVVIFPEDPALWTPHSRRIATGRPDQTGQFRIVGLPSGRYRAIALNFLEPGTERDPSILSRLTPRAEVIALGEGESRSVRFTRVDTY